MEIVKVFLDYGVAVAVCVGIIVVFVKMILPRLDRVDETMSENKSEIKALTSAIAAQTAAITSMIDACKQAFDDNRKTIEILLRDRNK